MSDDLSAEDKVKSYQGFIDGSISSLRSYHDHKETRAWVATALYVPSIMAVAWSIGPQLRFCTLPVALAALLVFFVIVFVFVNRQFSWRWEADNEVKGLHRARDMLLNDPETRGKLRIDDSLVPSNTVEIWPEFIRQEIKKVGEASPRLKFDSRLATELLSYLAIVVASLVAMFFLASRIPVHHMFHG